jgi:hypothetical protein
MHTKLHLGDFPFVGNDYVKNVMHEMLYKACEMKEIAMDDA